MTDHSTNATRLHSAPSVRFEPCMSFHDDDATELGLCAGCGWPSDDHDGDTQPKAA